MINAFYNLIKILRGEKRYWDVPVLWGIITVIYWGIALFISIVLLDTVGIIKLP